MSNIIKIKLTPEVITDFEECFDDKQKERSYLYQKVSEKINKSTGDVFLKRSCIINIQVDNKKTAKSMSFEELGFDSVEIPLDPAWVPNDLPGTMVDFEYLTGDMLYMKIMKYCRLFLIHNNKYQESVKIDFDLQLQKLKDTEDTTEEQIKNKQKGIDAIMDQLAINDANNCMEGFLYGLFAPAIFEKIEQHEKEMMDKEFKELNEPKEKPKR